MKWKWFLLVVSAGFFLFGLTIFAKDGEYTGIEIRDREQYLHRLKFLRMKRPDDVQHTFQLGNLYYSLQMEDEAIKEYRRVLKKDPEHLDSKWFLSHVLVSKGYFEEAFRLAREIMERKPEDPEIYYWAGQILVKLDQQNIAKEYFSRCDELLLEQKKPVRSGSEVALKR